MPVLKNVTGLDVGSHGLKAVEFRQSLRSFEAVQMRSLDRPGEDAALADILPHFLSVHELSTDHVVTALPGDHLSQRRLSFPFRDRKRLAQAVPFEVEADIPFDLEDVIVDWEIVGGEQNHADVVAHVAPRAEVASIIDTLRGAGCDPRTIEAEGFVLGNLAAVFELSGVHLVADLGHRKTTFCLLVHGQPVAARSVPVAGHALTRAVALDRGVDADEATRRKCGGELLDAGRASDFPGARAVLDRIARELARTVASFESLGATGAGGITQTTLVGGTAQLAGIDAFLGERTGIPTVRIGLPRGEAGSSLAAAGDPVLFAPAIALAIRGTSRAVTRTNFRQDDFAYRVQLLDFGRDFRWTGILAAAVAALAVISFGTQTVVDSRRRARTETAIAELYGEAFPRQPTPAQPLSTLRDAVQSAHERAEFLGVYRGNLSALDLLAEISRLVPKDLEIVFEELSIDRQTVRMRVYAKSFRAADRLGSELQKFGPFSQARIGAIESDRKSGGKRFTVTISLAETGEQA